MSVEALTWVFEQAPDVAPHEVPVLVGLANHAHPDGTGAWPGVPRLARYSRKGERAVQKDVQSLLSKGLIRKGDQRLVAHYPPDRRPVVYDLAMERRLDGGIVQPPTRVQSGKAPQPILPPAESPASSATTWPAAASEGASASPARLPHKGGKRCPLPGHQSYLMASCVACKADRMEAERDRQRAAAHPGEAAA
jgi:hypothetical protein